MSDASLIVRQSLGDGRFVVTSNCRYDVPIGTGFTVLFSELKSYSNGDFVLEESGPTIAVDLRITSVEFWRKPWHCVPNGHHAGVILEGDGIQALESYVSQHPSPWSVFISNSDGV